MNIEPAIDCHAHIIDPERFAFVRGAGYTPQPHERGTRESFIALLDRHGVRHVLLVQPSCYAVDNSAMLDAIGQALTDEQAHCTSRLGMRGLDPRIPHRRSTVPS